MKVDNMLPVEKDFVNIWLCSCSTVTEITVFKIHFVYIAVENNDNNLLHYVTAFKTDSRHFGSDPSLLLPVSLPSSFATTGVRATVGGNRTGDSALCAA